jgi:dihydrofolate reductase
VRTVVATVYTSLDGVIRRPEKWSMAYFTEQSAAYQTDLLSRTEALLQGRQTYESFAQFWNQPSDDAYNQRMYELPKVMVSRTATTGAWNNTTVSSDPATAVQQLKQEGDGTVLTYGFGSIAYALLDAGLLDEVHVWIHPVLARDAAAEDLLFRPGTTKTPLNLRNSTSLDSGVTILHLATAPA